MTWILDALRWVDVDPDLRDFDVRQVRACVEAALAVAPDGPPRVATVARQEAVDHALLAAFRPWITGWRSARPYCCPGHSLQGTTAEQAEMIVTAVASWRRCLETLAGSIAELKAEGLALEDAAPRAAARLLPFVLEWTEAEDAWYATLEIFVAWALEAQGVDPEVAAELTSTALDGRFSSWVVPNDPEPAFEALREAARALVAPRPEDSTSRWLTLREEIRWYPERPHRTAPVHTDGHERFIDTVDAARDVVRAHRTRQALTRARAETGSALDLPRLASWQRVVLGEPAPLRESDAYAHDGRERYGTPPDLRARFERCLAQATEPGLPATARAARVYLDVCFVHPFADGNGRAARLALDYVLTREGLALHAPEPVFLVARRASDALGALRLQSALEYLVGERATR